MSAAAPPGGAPGIPRVVAVVLAAGRGERMGGPKALLVWPAAREPLGHGRLQAATEGPATVELPLAAAHVLVHLARGAAEALVVVREPLVDRLARWLPAAAHLVVSHAPDSQGQSGSLAAAATWLARERPGERSPELVLVTPVDCPPPAARVGAGLVGELAANPTLRAVRPSHAGRRGHPVALRSGLLERYLGREPPTLRALLASLGAAVRDLPVDDPTVLVDLDAPADLAALGLGPPRFVA